MTGNQFADLASALNVALAHREPVILDLGTAVLSLVALDSVKEAESAQLYLSWPEREYFNGLSFRKRRLEWLAGRMAVKRGVAAFLRQACPYPEIPLLVEEQGERKGRPFVRQPCHVSLTHSGGFAIGIAAEYPIGIDLEKVRRFSPEVASYCFQNQELDRLTGSGGITLGWCFKEAFLKRLGLGLRGGMRDLEITQRCSDGRIHWILRDGLLSRWQQGLLSHPTESWGSILGDFAFALTTGPMPTDSGHARP